MHKYRLPSTHVGAASTLDEEDALGLDSADGPDGASYPPQPRGGMSAGTGASSTTLDSAVRPLMEALHDEDGQADGAEVIFDGDEEADGGSVPGSGQDKGKGRAVDGQGQGEGDAGEIVPYAHRDIKPG